MPSARSAGANEGLVMPKIKAEFRINSKTWATFDGYVEPDTATGYRFEGTITAITMLDRSSADFPNKVRIGHGGTKNKYERLEFEIQGVETENTFTVKGHGSRQANDTVDFYVGLNNGVTGSFKDGPEVTTAVGGPSQKLTPVYQKRDSYDALTYDVRFDGSARADGETGFVLTGAFDGSDGPGTMTTQSATLGYKTDSGSWQYKTYAFKDLPQEIRVVGTRKPGEGLTLQLGATSGVANVYQYGDQEKVTLPDTF
ncbi:hypothetical protein [Streptomyces sp. NPDC057554]|uniref:hypothetical protein n=1 Tax=unclassified Streptomyces TaxID=2593676 RepID=UPI00367C8E07